MLAIHACSHLLVPFKRASSRWHLLDYRRAFFGRQRLSSRHWRLPLPHLRLSLSNHGRLEPLQVEVAVAPPEFIGESVRMMLAVLPGAGRQRCGCRRCASTVVSALFYAILVCGCVFDLQSCRFAAVLAS